MGAATPDAFRVGAGAQTRDYPGGVAARLSARPSLPERFSGPAAPASVDTAPTPVVRRPRAHTPAPKPQVAEEAPRVAAIAPAVERTVIAVVPPLHSPASSAPHAVTPTPVRATPATGKEASSQAILPVATPPKSGVTSSLGASGHAPRESRVPAHVAQTASNSAPAVPVSRFAPDVQLTPEQRSFAPRQEDATVREYAHFDEAEASSFEELHTADGVREGRGVPSRADVALSRRASPAPRLVTVDQMRVRAAEVEDARRREAREYSDENGAERPPLRRDRARHRKRSRRGLGMFFLGFIVAIILVAALAAGVYFLRFGAANKLAAAVDSCHAHSSYTRLATDSPSLTVEVSSDSAPGLAMPVFRCILDELDAPASMRERMAFTRAIDGTQEDQWSLYRATWTYHPEQGLNVVISAC